MSQSTVNLEGIPPIGASQMEMNSFQKSKEIKKPDVALFDNAPNEVTA